MIWICLSHVYSCVELSLSHIAQFCREYYRYCNGIVNYAAAYIRMYICVIMCVQSMAEACICLAAKTEEQPRKLEHIIKVTHLYAKRGQPMIDSTSKAWVILDCFWLFFFLHNLQLLLFASQASCRMPVVQTATIVKDVLFVRNPLQSYVASPAIWDHKVLSATWHRWMRPALISAMQININTDGFVFSFIIMALPSSTSSSVLFDECNTNAMWLLIFGPSQLVRASDLATRMWCDVSALVAEVNK